MNIVLVEPEIPQNTGNISRTCVLTGSALHLIEPMGFSLEDRYLKRAGLDYWSYLEFYSYRNWNEFIEYHPGERFLFFSTKGKYLYTEANYQRGDFLVFGSETQGLPADLLTCAAGNIFRIPMARGISRSLNLSNSVAIVLFEALRCLGFPEMT